MRRGAAVLVIVVLALVLGDWNYVERDGACGEIANRTTTLTFGASGSQTVNDTALNWRNVSPCGN
jgi:hypothetical protein